MDERLQKRLAVLLLALASADYDQLVDALLEIGVAASTLIATGWDAIWSA